MSASVPAIPSVGKPRPVKIPPHAEQRLPNGLRVIAIRRPTVPRVEMRLRIPAGLVHDPGDGARARLMPEVLLGGTAERDAVEIARALQRIGGSLGASVDADDLVVGGGVLARNLGEFLDLAAEVVIEPSFPADEVAVARDRVAQEIVIQRSQPNALAAEITSGRVFGKHRYGRGLPNPDAVRRVSPAPIRRYHGENVLPAGATLVLVGSLQPDKAIARVAQAFKPWKGRRAAGDATPPAPPAAGRPTLLVDRPGAVQTNIRVAGPAVPRTHADFYKLALANMIFGGYFTSRLVRNIREDKGYTYGPGSVVVHRKRASVLTVVADVGSAVTLPALLEVRYELSRMAAQPVDQDELDSARRYLAGVTTLQLQTQAGMASYVDALIAAGLDLEYVRAFRANLERVTIDDVLDASMRYLAPRNLSTILVGDGAHMRAGLAAFDDVEDGALPG